jgi:hypothetical protein
MKSHSDFWLTLHVLANDLEKEGDTNEDRIRTLLEVLHSLSPATQSIYQENALFVLRALNSLAISFDGGSGTGRPTDES